MGTVPGVDSGLHIRGAGSPERVGVAITNSSGGIGLGGGRGWSGYLKSPPLPRWCYVSTMRGKSCY